jgi:hypothetical protein
MGELSEVKIKAPLGNYRSDRTEAQALNELSLTKQRAGAILRKIADIHSIPQYFALAFTCIETGGKAIRSADGVSYGMMQTNAATLDGVIKSAFKYNMTIEEFKYIYYACKPAFRVKPNVELPPLNWTEIKLGSMEEIQAEVLRRAKIMAQSVGSVLTYANPTHILSTGGGYNKPTNAYNLKMIQQPEFGVHIGCMYLYELITKSIVKEGDTDYIRVDWVINGYNGGYFSRFNPWMSASQKNYSPDVWLNQAGVPAVTKAYVKRLAGIGGYLELIKNKKFVV